MSNGVQAFIDWLVERRAFLRNLEAEASRSLNEENDIDRYRELMRQKAMFLAAMAKEAEPYLACLPPNSTGSARARETLRRFSQGAEQALSLDSVFYMAALLYPDEHKQGDPNNLDIFLELVESWR